MAKTVLQDVPFAAKMATAPEFKYPEQGSMQRLRQIFLNDAKLDRHTPVRFSLCLLAGLLIFPVFAPTIGQAQNVDLQTLNQRIERLQRDLNILQKDYYRGEKRGAKLTKKCIMNVERCVNNECKRNSKRLFG